MEQKKKRMRKDKGRYVVRPEMLEKRTRILEEAKDLRPGVKRGKGRGMVRLKMILKVWDRVEGNYKWVPGWGVLMSIYPSQVDDARKAMELGLKLWEKGRVDGWFGKVKCKHCGEVT